MYTLAQVAAFAGKLPGVTVGTKYNHKTWIVAERGFAWERAFSKADLGRFGDDPVPDGDILAISTESLDAKEALLAMELPGFFTIPHFNGFPAVLVQLKKARAADVKAALSQAHDAATRKGSPSSRARSSRPRAARSRPRPRAG